jgi:tetratricopeptide (TPR) repeat protein
MLSLNVFGRFMIVDAEGCDRSPKASKARGVLALLAMSQGYARNRVWLQDKLWSDRDSKKGSDSLRQTLVEIRRAFGPHQAALKTDREKIALDPSHFAIKYQLQSATDDWIDEQDAFADLDIHDPEFEDWIRNLRASLANKARAHPPHALRSHNAPKPAIFFESQSDNQPMSELIVSRLMALTTTSLRDLDDFQIFPGLSTASGTSTRGPTTGIAVSVRTITVSRYSHVAFALQHAETRQLYWSRTVRIPTMSEDALHHECGTLVQAILSTFRERMDDLKVSNSAAMLASQARALIFRFDRHSLRDADLHLRYAYDREARPQYLAWRAFLRNMAQFQHRSSAFLDDKITSAELVQEALRQDSNSASILGIGAHLEYLGGGSNRGSLRLAERAVNLDPLNAINMAILSNTELVLDKLENSRSSAVAALAMTGGGEHRAFAEFFCCMSAAALGDYSTAIGHAEAALTLRPAFRAPLRYLIALYKQVGMTMQMERAILQLRQLEPDFVPSRFLDSDYPVTTMRRIRLIETIAG